MKRTLYPLSDMAFHKHTSYYGDRDSRAATVTVHRNFAGTMLVEDPIARERESGNLIGADRDHPVRYEHELHDVFDQFLESR